MGVVRDYKIQSNKYLDRLIYILNEIDMKEKSQIIKSEVDSLINRYNPSIMFYGVYNAGKSSLVNALFGKYIAEVGDIPTTCKVTEYSYGGFKIVDTPGINGPDEHWIISENEIKKHDVILFVVDDSDTFDSLLVSQEIVRIVELKKPLILVMNIKNGPSYREEKIEKLISNINNVCKDKKIDNIQNKFDIIAVEIEAAYEGKIEENCELIKYTGIEDLESIISKSIKLINDTKMLIVPIDILIKEMQYIIEEIKNKIENTDEIKYIEKINMLEDIKKSVFINISYILRREINIISEKIFLLCSEGKNPESEISLFRNRIEDLVKYEFQKIGHLINLSLKNSSDSNFQPIESFQFESIDLKNLKYKKEETKDGFGEILDNIPIPIPTPMPIPIPVNIIYKALKILLGNSSGTLDEDSIKKIQEQNAKNIELANKKVTAIIDLNSKIRSKMYKLEEDYLDEIRNIIFNYFDENIESIKKEYTELFENDKNINLIIESLKNLLNEIEIFRSELL